MLPLPLTLLQASGVGLDGGWRASLQRHCNDCCLRAAAGGFARGRVMLITLGGQVWHLGYLGQYRTPRLFASLDTLGLGIPAWTCDISSTDYLEFVKSADSSFKIQPCISCGSYPHSPRQRRHPKRIQQVATKKKEGVGLACGCWFGCDFLLMTAGSVRSAVICCFQTVMFFCSAEVSSQKRGTTRNYKAISTCSTGALCLGTWSFKGKHYPAVIKYSRQMLGI